MAMLQVDSINVFYGSIHAIKDVSFSVEQGEIVTLIGANGAGKSTILKTVSGLLRSKGGLVQFHDNSITGAAPHRIVSMGLAHVPEGRHVFAQMTVEENLEMGAYTQPRSSVDPNLERVFDTIDFPVSIHDGENCRELTHIQGKVDFNHVTFAYDEGVNILEDFDLHVKPGETIALVGPTGAGKTTIINMLTRFSDVSPSMTSMSRRRL